MTNTQAVLSELIGGIINWSYLLSMPLGVWAAFQNDSFLHGAASVIVPFYGIIYWFIS